MLLGLLWVTGVTGFVLELALYLPCAPAWGYWVFLLHVAVAMELVLLAPFMKLAHAVYRPVALFFVALARDGAANRRLNPILPARSRPVQHRGVTTMTQSLPQVAHEHHDGCSTTSTRCRRWPTVS